MDYLKLDPDIDSNPEVMRAGWGGARFFELLIKVSARKDLRGRIPPAYQDLEWLAHMWNLRASDLGEAITVAGFMARSLDAATRAGLLQKDGDDWVLRGWEKFYKPAKSGAQRTAEWREKQDRDECDEAPSQQNTRDGGDECDATPPTPPTHTTPPTKDISLPVSEEAPPLLTPEEAKATSSIDRVANHYVEAMLANGHRVRVTKKTRRLIKARLDEGFSVEELMTAVDGLTWSDWHMGRDPKTNGQSYTAIKYCLGDADRVVDFIARVPEAHRRTG